MKKISLFVCIVWLSNINYSFAAVSNFAISTTESFVVENEQAISKWNPFHKNKKKSKSDTKQENDSSKTTLQYNEIVKPETITQKGMFAIHQLKNNYYFEIADTMLGRDFLVVNKLQKVPIELNDAGVNKGINYQTQLIRFELDIPNKKLLVRRVTPLPYVPQGDAIALSVAENYLSSLIDGFKIEAFNKDSSTVIIKINDIYNGSNTSINNLFDNLNIGTTANKNTSRILNTKSFKDNVVITSELSTKVTEGRASIPLTAEISSSMILLPKEPMKARYANTKVGFFHTSQLQFSDKQQKIEEKEIITRWRLEPHPEDITKYLAGELVEPIKPIVFYLDKSTPYQWRKYLKKGIEDWQVAFEKAGFKNAIIAKELTDSIIADSDDINYSVVTYLASAKVNAMGPSIYDPRSGEIIEADIIWWHNVISMLQKWITVQTSTVNPAAQSLTLPDSLIGDAMRFVVCHEVGHSLGLRHNMMGSGTVPTDSLRSKTFTDKLRSTSNSIMDYARFNYVAQPEDGVKELSPHIGDYDIYAIEYGYRWYNNKGGIAENLDLYNLVNQHKDKKFKFGDAQDSRDAIDPRSQSEDLGDNPELSSTYGIKNLQRIMPNLVKWTISGENGQSYFEAARLYYAVINQWNNYLYHVLTNVGGIYLENTTVGDGVQTYQFVEKEKQKSAVKFILNEAFNDVKWLFGTEINQYTYPVTLSPIGNIENSPYLILKNAQSYLYWDLLSNSRITRMMENERLNGNKAFTAVEMMDMLHQHAFGITEKGGTPDISLRSIQKGLVDALILASSQENSNKVAKTILGDNILFQNDRFCSKADCDHATHTTENNDTSIRNIYFTNSQTTRISDAISIKRGELLRIKELMQRKEKSSDLATRYHYKDIVLRINTALGIK